MTGRVWLAAARGARASARRRARRPLRTPRRGTRQIGVPSSNLSAKRIALYVLWLGVLLAVLRRCHSSQKPIHKQDCAEVLTKCCAQHVQRSEVASLMPQDLIQHLFQPGTTMISSSRRDRQAKAIAELLAMIAEAHPEIGGGRPRPAFAANEESLWEDVTEFSAALERFRANCRHHRISGKFAP